MSCTSCKKKNIKTELNPDNLNDKTLFMGLFEYFVRFIIFLMSLVTLPIVVLFTVYMLFKVIVMKNNRIDVMPFLLKIGNKLKKKNKDSDFPNDFEDLDVTKPENYKLVDVEEIK